MASYSLPAPLDWPTRCRSSAPRPHRPREDERVSEQQDKVTWEGGGESALVPTLPPTGKGFRASRLPSLGLTATSLVRGHREGLKGRAWLLDSDSNLSLASPFAGHVAHFSPSRPSGSVHVCLTYFPSEKLARCSIEKNRCSLPVSLAKRSMFFFFFSSWAGSQMPVPTAVLLCTIQAKLIF